MQKSIFLRGGLALAMLSFTLMGSGQQKSARKAASVHSSSTNWSENHQYLNIDEDSTVNPPQTIISYKSKDLYNIVLSGGKVASMYVNGRQIPADSFSVYDDVIKRVKAQMERDRAQAIRDREEAGRDQIQAGKDAEQAQRDKRQAEKDAVQAKLDKEQAERDEAQAAREKDSDKAQAGRDAAQAMRDKQQAERDAEQAVRDKQQAERDAQQAVRDKEQARLDKIQAEEDKALLKSLIAEVIKAGLAPDEKSITSLTLNDDVLYVNGKKQSDELQQKFKAKFIKKEGYSIHFHNGSMSVGRMDN